MRASEAAALLYIAIPFPIFLATFLQPVIGTLCLVGVGLVLWSVPIEVARPQGDRSDIALVALAFLWMLPGGIWPGGGQGSDWLKHSAILNLLVAQPWPPMEAGSYLRYPVAWYLVPAGLAKLMPSALEWLVGAWTLLGTYLSLRIIANCIGTAWGALVFVVFSGADILGYLITLRQIAPLHLEWWAYLAQISSTTTSLFWVPQHATPGWIVVALLMSATAPVSRIAAPIACAVFFWSPFTLAGLIPFFLLRWARDGFWTAATVANVVATLLTVPLLAYFLSQTAAIPAMFVWSGPFFRPALVLPFLLLEWGAVAVLLALIFRHDRTRLEWLACAVIVFSGLSFAYVGIYSDLTMRGTQPAVACLAILSAIALAQHRNAIATTVLAGLIGVGSLTGFFEVSRTLREPRHSSPALTITNILPQEYWPQYLAPNPPFIRRRQPAD